MKTQILEKANKFAEEHASSSLDNFEYDEVHDCLKFQGDMGYFEEYSNWSDFFAESLSSGLQIIGLSENEIEYFFENDLEDKVLSEMCDAANTVFEDYLEELKVPTFEKKVDAIVEDAIENLENYPELEEAYEYNCEQYPENKDDEEYLEQIIRDFLGVKNDEEIDEMFEAI